MPLQTWVARFVVDHGQVTEEGGLLRAFLRRRLDEGDVDLYILAEPKGGKAQDLGSQAVENIGRLFLDDRFSLTGGLLRALHSTHQTLLDWNRRSVPGDQVSSGITAALVSGTTVFLCQAGPGLAFVKRAGSLDQLQVEPAALVPIGEPEFEPDLRRFELQPGELILVASESLLSIVDLELLENLFSRGTDAALPELYLLTRDLPSFQLFVVTCRETNLPAPEPFPSDGETPQLEPESPPSPAYPKPPAPGNTPPPTPEDRTLTSPPDRAAETSGDPTLPLDISRTVVRLRGEQSLGHARYPRSTGPSRALSFGLFHPPLLVILGILALILILGVLTVPDLIRESRGERVNDLLQQAQIQLNAAIVETDTARQRQYLDEASSLAAEALRIEPENQIAAGLRAQATSRLETMNAVFDLGPLTTIITLSGQITGEVSIERFTIAGDTAYLLDSKGGRVIAISLASQSPIAILYQQGETYGEIPAQTPIFIAWDGGEDDGRLLILDSERKLFASRPGSPPEPVPLRRTNTWTSVAAMTTFDGNLYVLDPLGNQVHRYFPASSGFDSEPGPALSGQPDLEDAVGLAVNGDIFILRRDGQILHFQAGVDLGFSLAGIDRPLKGPAGISVVPASAEVYITDAGNKRIVVATLDGVFRRQLVSTDFTDLRAIAVDSSGTQLYVIAGDAILTTAIVR